MARTIYLDHAATTPLHPDVAALMADVQREHFANPTSVHSLGRAARGLIEQARRQVADLIGAEPDTIVFTNGGTEANNFVIRGVVEAASATIPRPHVITSAIEHASVLATCRALEQKGAIALTIVPVDRDGLVDPASVAAALRPETVLVSIMLANNEIGTLQPVAGIAPVVREHGALLHTDAVQALGKIPVAVDDLDVDFLTGAAHKLYGPKGVGLLYIRHGRRKHLQPQLFGGGQEGGMRPGTENTAALAGFGLAAAIAARELEQRMTLETAWRDRLIAGLTSRIEDVILNGHPTRRLPNNVNISIGGVDIQSLLIQLDLAGIAASSASACSAGSVKPSHVLQAIGRSEEASIQALRLTLGRANRAEDIDVVLETLPAIVGRLRGAQRFVVPRG